ncbi:hypothetical protein TorRG33x02_064790, partial [Trema orientale]
MTLDGRDSLIHVTGVNQIRSLGREIGGNGFFVWIGISVPYHEGGKNMGLVFGLRENSEQLGARISSKMVHLSWFCVGSGETNRMKLWIREGREGSSFFWAQK